MVKTLRVRARGTSLVLDQEYGAQTGQRRYIGRETVMSWEEPPEDPSVPCVAPTREFLEPGMKPLPWMRFPSTGAVATVPNTAFYRKQLAGGSLWAADHETAREVGVDFDPYFGGE